MRSLFPLLLLLTLAAPAPLRAGGPAGVAPAAELDLSSVPGLVEASTLAPSLRVELKYATADNFVGRPLYTNLTRCWLQREAAKKLAEAARLLEGRAPGHRLLAFDCARPHRVQLQMWEVVKGTPSARYVANPHSKTGSLHSYGCAIDLSLAGPDGAPLDMGTPYDHFGEAAHPRHELRLFREGRLSKTQLANRLLLREVMIRAGFLPISNEWWHFNCATPAQTRARFQRVP